MIKKMLEEEIELRKMSIRAAAREIDVAHTTLLRILQGDEQSITYGTLIKIANWMGVSPSVLVVEKTDSVDELASQIAAFLRMNPDLACLFGEAVQRVLNGEMEPCDLNELVAYATWKLELGRKAEVGKDQ
jgi:transcriptional regulator with XRE-family HTH domain